MHPITLIILAIFALTPTLVGYHFLKSLALIVIALPFYFYSGLKIRTLIKVVALVCFLSLPIFLVNIAEAHSPNYLQIALVSWARISMLTCISILTARCLDFPKMLVYLMSKHKLKPRIGYAILVAINSIALLKAEKERIERVMKLRNIKARRKVFIAIPLLIFAIRHANRAATALVARGLNDNKTYVNDYKIPKIEWLWVTSCICCFIAIFLIF